MTGPEFNNRPQLSVVIATIEPWPVLKECLNSLLEQVQAVDGEVIIADGNGQALPVETVFSNVVWLPEIGASVFRLRALGLQKARGDIVAFTEDHCIVAPDWSKRIIELHHTFPESVVISGVIENGATDSILDWVHFLMSKGPCMRPIKSGETDLIAGEANTSFKKHIISSNLSDADTGRPFYERLQRQGHRFLIHDSLMVWHIQSLGFKGCCQIHFHNGRTIAGFRRAHLSLSLRIARLASCAVLPAFLVMKTVMTVFQKRRQRLVVLLGLPFLMLIAACHATGEFIGYLWGPGTSPQKVN
ncbi:glycosyltransferase family 2 protein [candidate division CSSED10-310 bacterium]|uniref:Glycosyltransferase family 2 protein n=1 Tax=candidate division CSSED10-310 bacterium TaxID=2855610 RepID=A0ABV6Z1F4_UNCC1